tara:strand:- start:675 stop:893 length:219 start_codon:yes stop_codon:yes gene_type:complete
MYKIYTQNNCGYCIAAKNLLDKKGEQYEEIHLEDNPDAKNKLKQDGLRTVPQIWLDEEYIGGYVELERKYNV